MILGLASLLYRRFVKALSPGDGAAQHNLIESDRETQQNSDGHDQPIGGVQGGSNASADGSGESPT